MARSLREQQPSLWPGAALEVRVALAALGQHVAAVTAAQGGLVLETSPAARIAAIISAANLEGWIAQRFSPIYERLYRATANQTMATLTKEGYPITERSKIEARVLKELGKRTGLIDLNKQTKESLFRILRTARELGIGANSAAYLIEDMIPRGRFVYAGTRYRAELIAESEALHAQRIATIESSRRSPQIKELIAFDGDGDEICLARNGTRFSFDEAEVETNNTHPKCVLAFGPVV